MRPRSDARTWLVSALPVLAAGYVWFTALSFVPVPWPDDSAFYFVGREFFKWPPRWVMLPQAPFEPTYRIFNFNTMPLYPILVGLGRFIGIDGSWGVKFWPLAAWAASGVLLGRALCRARMPALLAALMILPVALDPGLRWAAVLLRPESLIGLFGLAIVLGLTLGFPRSVRPRGFWDPVAMLLALAAYAHFNAVHLLFPVVLTFLHKPRRLFDIGWKTSFYLSPWLLAVLWHWSLFTHQMGTQWKRLQGGNSWLQSVPNALRSVFQDMGSPEPWPEVLRRSAWGIWLLIFAALFFGLLVPLSQWALRRWDEKRGFVLQETSPVSLLPAGAWVLGSLWLWNGKPEVWFTYYIHLSLWCFLALGALKAWKSYRTRGFLFLPPIIALTVAFALVFGYVNYTQAERLGASASWHWGAYRSFVDCIDARLSLQAASSSRSGTPSAPFQVWDPTFPDVTIELSRRHPDWELTRTNDFWDRSDLAVQHGREVDAVVVTETINETEREISGPAAEHPDVQSVWMNWKDYFLHRLHDDPQWKPFNRYICQRGRWAAFIYLK